MKNREERLVSMLDDLEFWTWFRGQEKETGLSIHDNDLDIIYSAWLAGQQAGQKTKEETIAYLRRRLVNQRQTISDLQEELWEDAPTPFISTQSKDATIYELRQRVGNQRKTILELQEQCQQAQDKLKDVRADYDREIYALKHSGNASENTWKKEFEAQEQRNKTLVQELADKESECQELESDLESAKKDVKYWKEATQSTYERECQAKAELGKAQGELEDLRMAIEAWQNHNKLSESVISNLRNDLSGASNQVENYRVQILKLKNELESANQIAQEWEEAFDEAQERAVSLKQRTVRYCEDIAKLAACLEKERVEKLNEAQETLNKELTK